MAAGSRSPYHDPHCPVNLRHRIRRDYPKQGDSATAFWEETGKPQEGIFLVRPCGESFTVYAVIRCSACIPCHEIPFV